MAGFFSFRLLIFFLLREQGDRREQIEIHYTL
jgi:hypothetical protein